MEYSWKTENYKTSFEHVIKILMGCLKMWIKVIKARHDISKYQWI